jgi:polysaccharide biosynthesis/export protein PslD
MARFRHLQRPAAAALSVLLLAGCTTQTTTPRQADGAAFETWSDASPAYRFGPADRIKVEFLLTPEAGEDVVVGPDGFIGLRVAGRVRAQGLTAEQLQDAVTLASARNLTHPIVTVSLLDAGSARIIVGGQVSRPGVYKLVGRDSPFEAVMMAGGFLPESRMDEVVLIRRNADNHPMLRTVDLQHYVNTGDLGASVPLQAGDVVFVPRTRVAEAGLWVDQVLNKLLPFSKSLNYNINPNPNEF